MSADIEGLADQLAALARPGIAVDVADGRLRLKVVTREPPPRALWVCSGAVRARLDDAAARARLIRAFDAFNDAAAMAVDEATRRGNAPPAMIAQDIFNRAVMRNPHGLLDLVDLSVDFVADDPSLWRAA